MREGDLVTRRDALLHYSLAETLYSADGAETNARTAAEKRASIARILTPDEIAEEQNFVASWMPSAAQRAPEDDLARLREDLKLLDNLARSLKQEEMKLVLSEIANRIAATQRSDGALVNEGRRKAAFLASGYGKPLADRTVQNVLDRWSAEFGSDRGFMITMLARLLSAMENENRVSGITQTSDLVIYKKVTELIIGNLQSPDLEALANGLSFSRKAFSYSTVREADPELLVAAASALMSRDKLLTLLTEYDAKNYNYLTHRGIGRFWMGISVNNARESKVGKVVQDLVGSRSKNINDAITDLKRARELGDRDFDTLHRLADGQRWLFAEAPRSDFNVEGKDAIENYTTLTNALEDKHWATSVSKASLLSERANALRNLSGLASALDRTLEQGWRSGDKNIRTRSTGLILDSLYYASLADRAAKEALEAPGKAWGTEPGKNRSFAFALAKLANRLLSEKHQLPPADDCDILASHPEDPLRRASGVTFADLENVSKFECRRRKLASVHIESGLRTRAPSIFSVACYLHPRTTRKRAGNQMFGEAAARNYAIVLNSISIILKQEEAKYQYSFVQLVLRDHFSTTFKYLSTSAAADEKYREALRWLAEQAAEIGVAGLMKLWAEMTSDQQQAQDGILIGR